MKNTGWKTLIIAVLCAFIALPAVAADKGKAPKFPAEISIGEGPISLNRAVDIAIANSRTLKANELDFESARRKVSETKAQFGFDVKLKGNAVQSHMNSTISMPYTTYDVSAATSSVVLDPSSLQTPTSPVFVITNPYPVIRYNTFSLVKEWSHSSELDVTKMLYTFGKKRDAIKATGGQRDMAKIDVGIGKLDLIENVKKSFFNVLLTQEFVQVQEEAVRQAEAHLSAAKSRFEVGAAPKFDVIRAEVEVATAKENLTTAIKGLDLSKMALNNTIGLPVSRNIKVSDEGAYEKITIQAMEYYLGVADKNRPELMKLKIAQDVARASRRLAENKPYLAFQWGWSFYNKGGGFSSSEHTWNAVVAAEVPVFDNGLAKAKMDQASRLHDKLMLNEVDAREGIALEVTQAYLGLIEAGQRIETSEAIFNAAEEGYRMAEVGFKEGVTTSIDLLDAEHGLTQAKLNRAKASFDYETQKARLARACGMESLNEKK